MLEYKLPWSGWMDGPDRGKVNGSMAAGSEYRSSSKAVGSKATRNSLTFVNTTAIAYMQKVGRSLNILVYAIAVVFTNVRELRVHLDRSIEA